MGKLADSHIGLKSSIDGIDLVLHRWVPDGVVKHVLVIHHGFGDHGLRYQGVIEALNRGDTAFYALDARGHGHSQGKRGHARQFDDFVTDLHTAVQWAQKEFPAATVALFGHSMGGAIVLNYCLRESFQRDIKFLLVSAPALRVKMTVSILIKKLIGESLAKYFPAYVVKAGLDPSRLSHDARIVRAYQEDALVHGDISLALGAALFAIGDQIISQAKKITIPVYLFHGTSDQICLPVGSEELFHQLASEDKQLRFYPKLRHETFNESEEGRRQVLSDLANWVGKHR